MPGGSLGPNAKIRQERTAKSPPPPARVGNQAGLRLNYRDRLKNSESFALGTRFAPKWPNLALTWRLRAATCHFGTGKASVGTARVPIALGTTAPDWCGRQIRPRADFFAQLIATAAQAPQTRARRRAQPAEAVAIYGAIDRRPAAQPPRSAVRCEVHACEASISTCRCELRIETMKPASTSTSAIMVSRKKVEVPACRTSRNSISMTMNSPIART
jgi:hypothetical protein